MKDPYESIRGLPHHVSLKHPRMSMEDRAAQFSPFAALTGYGDEVTEAARLTDTRQEQDEGMKAVIDMRLRLLAERLNEHPEITVSYFVPDERKDGGRIRSVTGCAAKLRLYERQLVMQDGQTIPIDEITDVSGRLFDADDPLA